MGRFRTLLATLALVVAPAALQGQARSVTLTGLVRDVETLAPLDGLTVAIPDQNRSTMTDAEGRWVMRDLAAGEWIITIAGMGYTPSSERRTIADGVHLEIELTPQPIRMDEVVVDIETIDDVFRARRNASTSQSRLYTEDNLPLSAFATVRRLVEFQAGVVMCPATGAGPNPAAGIFSTSLQMSAAGIAGCVLSRGRVVPLAIYIDEEFTLGGMESLDAFNPAEIYAMEVRNAGTEVRLFTKAFIAKAMQGDRMLGRRPAPPPGGPGG